MYIGASVASVLLALFSREHILGIDHYKYEHFLFERKSLDVDALTTEKKNVPHDNYYKHDSGYPLH